MIPFIVGLFVGANLGYLVWGLMAASSKRRELEDVWVRYSSQFGGGRTGERGVLRVGQPPANPMTPRQRFYAVVAALCILAGPFIDGSL